MDQNDNGDAAGPQTGQERDAVVNFEDDVGPTELAPPEGASGVQVDAAVAAAAHHAHAVGPDLVAGRAGIGGREERDAMTECDQTGRGALGEQLRTAAFRVTDVAPVQQQDRERLVALRPRV